MLVNWAFNFCLYVYKNLFLLSNRFGGLFQGFQEIIPRNSKKFSFRDTCGNEFHSLIILFSKLFQYHSTLLDLEYLEYSCSFGKRWPLQIFLFALRHIFFFFHFPTQSNIMLEPNNTTQEIFDLFSFYLSLLCCTDFHPTKKNAGKWSGRLSILVSLPLKLFSAVNELTGYPGISGFWEQKIPGTISQVIDSMDSSFLPLCSKAHVKYSFEQDTPCVESNTTNTIPCRLISHLCPRSPFLSRRKCFLLCIVQILRQVMLQPFHIGHWFWLFPHCSTATWKKGEVSQLNPMLTWAWFCY